MPLCAVLWDRLQVTAPSAGFQDRVTFTQPVTGAWEDCLLVDSTAQLVVDYRTTEYCAVQSSFFVSPLYCTRLESD